MKTGIVVDTSVARASGQGRLTAAGSLPGKRAREVLEDLHVVGLAMLTGRRVLSLDDRQRTLLGRVVAAVESLRTLHWVSPQHPGAEKWLRAGGPETPAHCIGAQSRSPNR